MIKTKWCYNCKHFNGYYMVCNIGKIPRMSYNGMTCGWWEGNDKYETTNCTGV